MDHVHSKLTCERSGILYIVEEAFVALDLDIGTSDSSKVTTIFLLRWSPKRSCSEELRCPGHERQEGLGSSSATPTEVHSPGVAMWDSNSMVTSSGIGQRRSSFHFGQPIARAVRLDESFVHQGRRAGRRIERPISDRTFFQGRQDGPAQIVLVLSPRQFVGVARSSRREQSRKTMENVEILLFPQRFWMKLTPTSKKLMRRVIIGNFLFGRTVDADG